MCCLTNCLGPCCLRNSSIPRAMLLFRHNCRSQNAFLFSTQLSLTREQRDGLFHFIRLDVFHPLLETSLQKYLQVYFSISAWGILRQECGFSEAFLPWVQAVGNMLGFAILAPSAIPEGCTPASLQQIHSLLTSELL